MAVKALFLKYSENRAKASPALNAQEFEKVIYKRALREWLVGFSKYPERGQLIATTEIITSSIWEEFTIPDQNCAQAVSTK